MSVNAQVIKYPDKQFVYLLRTMAEELGVIFTWCQQQKSKLTVVFFLFLIKLPAFLFGFWVFSFFCQVIMHLFLVFY